MHLTDGSPEPLGVSVCGGGVNIAVHAPHATAVELCLFDDADTETARVVLPARTGGVWHGHVAGIGPGARYGLRAHGPFDPARGMRFNARKLLVDPYALELDRAFVLHPAMFENADDSAAFMPKAVVTRAGVLHSPSPSGEGDSRGERGGVLPEPPQSPTPVADATRPPQEGREKETLAPPAIAVRADRLALRQIAINLIANARQAAGSDGVVTVALETDGADLILIVDDDGPGISPDADTPRQGLGLALVRRLCALHGGSLVLHSQAGVGVTAVARLPVIGQA